MPIIGEFKFEPHQINNIIEIVGDKFDCNEILEQFISGLEEGVDSGYFIYHERIKGKKSLEYSDTQLQESLFEFQSEILRFKSNLDKLSNKLLDLIALNAERFGYSSIANPNIHFFDPDLSSWVTELNVFLNRLLDSLNLIEANKDLLVFNYKNFVRFSVSVNRFLYRFSQVKLQNTYTIAILLDENSKNTVAENWKDSISLFLDYLLIGIDKYKKDTSCDRVNLLLSEQRLVDAIAKSAELYCPSLEIRDGDHSTASRLVKALLIMVNPNYPLTDSTARSIVRGWLKRKPI